MAHCKLLRCRGPQGIMAVDPSRRAQIDELRELGFTVLPRFVPPALLATLNVVARTQLAMREGPLELEVDLRYPGAPSSAAAAGGTTVRRLLDAYARDPAFRESATLPAVRDWMTDYFGERVLLSRAHHNCLMTKHPLYGSLTQWHRDCRYWSFARDDLVSVWIALGVEHVDNGALWFVPGSHRLPFDADRFDEAKFFRADHPENAELLRSAECPRLAAGDAVFFHSNTLHSAKQNVTDAVKLSLVYTYHGCSNQPLPGTRSASRPEVELL
jgi:phytanoyl-CoA hydroxylase